MTRSLVLGEFQISHRDQYVGWVNTVMPHVVPLTPVAKGFAINTIFYGGILWMLLVFPGAVRRRVRIKRGQCASCGYSLRDITSDKCPECGAVVKRAQ